MEPELPVIESFSDLIQTLYKIFEDDVINVEYVKDVMNSYKSKPEEWRKFAKFDRYKYTRNLVDEGNGKFNILAVCWSEGTSSPIHDHPNSHCFMKVIAGTLVETKFAWPEEGVIDQEMKPLTETHLKLNETAYISDDIGLHRVENPSHSVPAVSLHLYIPPYNNCKAFDERTGRTMNCKVTFWSKFGRKSSPVRSIKKKNCCGSGTGDCDCGPCGVDNEPTITSLSTV